MNFASARSFPSGLRQFLYAAPHRSGDERFTRPAFVGAQRWLLLAVFAAIVIFRLPAAWVHGRFQDEEASVFLAYAWHYPWTSALFRPFAGYLNLGATASTVLDVALVKGGILPLELAPYLTMGIALAFQLLPAILILIGRAPWLADRRIVVVALLIIATAPATEEVFYNVLHIQFHLALCAALILALDIPPGKATRMGYCLLLVLAPLCGPGAIIILPLFVLRALIDRDPARVVQVGALAAGAALQLLLFYGASPLRGLSANPATVAAALFVRLIALPLIGIGASSHLGQMIYDPRTGPGPLCVLAALAAVVIVAVVIVAAAKCRNGAFWLALSGLAIAVASLGFGIVIVNQSDLLKPLHGERYNFLPLVLVGLSVLTVALRSSGWTKLLFGLPVCLMLVSGSIWYFRPSPEMDEGPAWPAEVRAWRTDHDHKLAVWPRPWAADLSDRTRPCSPPTGNLVQSTDPRYCESGWVAGIYRVGGSPGVAR